MNSVGGKELTDEINRQKRRREASLESFQNYQCIVIESFFWKLTVFVAD